MNRPPYRIKVGEIVTNWGIVGLIRDMTFPQHVRVLRLTHGLVLLSCVVAFVCLLAMGLWWRAGLMGVLVGLNIFWLIQRWKA